MSQRELGNETQYFRPRTRSLDRFRSAALEPMIAVATLGVERLIRWLVLLGKGVTRVSQISGLGTFNVKTRITVSSEQLFLSGVNTYFRWWNPQKVI